MRFGAGLLALTGLLMTTGASAQDKGAPASIKNPAAFVTMIKEMGFSPEPVTDLQKTPKFEVDIDGMPTTVRFIGCTAGKNCKYITFSGSYNDVINPPATWLQAMNDDFDILKVGLNANKTIYMFSSHVVEGLPRSTIRAILDYWAADTAAISDEAIKSNLVTKKK